MGQKCAFFFFKEDWNWLIKIPLKSEDYHNINIIALRHGISQFKKGINI